MDPAFLSRVNKHILHVAPGWKIKTELSSAQPGELYVYLDHSSQAIIHLTDDRSTIDNALWASKIIIDENDDVRLEPDIPGWNGDCIPNWGNCLRHLVFLDGEAVVYQTDCWLAELVLGTKPLFDGVGEDFDTVDLLEYCMGNPEKIAGIPMNQAKHIFDEEDEIVPESNGGD